MCVFGGVQDFLQRVGLEAELLDFCLKFGLDLLLMMTISFTESQEPIRELAVYSHNTTCREEVLQQYCIYSEHLTEVSSSVVAMTTVLRHRPVST